MGTSILPRVREVFLKAAKGLLKVPEIVARTSAVLGGSVITTGGVVALHHDFTNAISQPEAYALPFLAMPIGAGLSYLGFDPRKAMRALNNVIS